MSPDILFTNADPHAGRRPADRDGDRCPRGCVVRLDDDLGGRMVVPGFNDVHIRLSRLGEALLQVSLSPGTAPTR